MLSRFVPVISSGISKPAASPSCYMKELHPKIISATLLIDK